MGTLRLVRTFSLNKITTQPVNSPPGLFCHFFCSLLIFPFLLLLLLLVLLHYFVFSSLSSFDHDLYEIFLPLIDLYLYFSVVIIINSFPRKFVLYSIIPASENKTKKGDIQFVIVYHVDSV